MHSRIYRFQKRIVGMPYTPLPTNANAKKLARIWPIWYTRIRYAVCLAMSFLTKKHRVDVVSNRIIMYSITRISEVIRMGRWREWVWAVSYRKVFVGSRLCALKMMLHLSKNRDVSVALCGRRSSLWCWWILPIRIVCGRSYKFGSSSGECWAFSL